MNLARSELDHVGNVSNVDNLGNILGSKVSSLPIIYLGLPLGAFFKKMSIWDV